MTNGHFISVRQRNNRMSIRFPLYCRRGLSIVYLGVRQVFLLLLYCLIYITVSHKSP